MLSRPLRAMNHEYIKYNNPNAHAGMLKGNGKIIKPVVGNNNMYANTTDETAPDAPTAVYAGWL